MYDVQSIRRSNPIAEVAARFGVELRPAGRRLIGICPFHPEDQPSLVFYPGNSSYYCFGCGAGGDVIDFVARLQGIAFKDAAAMLAGSDQANTYGPANIVRLERAAQPPTLEETQVIEAAASFYHDALWRSREARAYVAGRGISSATIRRCRLGYGCRGLANFLRSRRLDLAAARSIGLLRGDRDAMLGRIVIPDLKADNATWLTGRSINGRDPRYFNLRLPTPLLGLSQVSGEEVIVTEGAFDWLTAVQWRLTAVGLLGTHISHSVVRALGRFRRVYAALDADEAGRRASAQLVAGLGSTAVMVHLPPGIHDLNDLGRLPDGRRAFLRCLADASEREERRWQTSSTLARAA